MLKPRYPLVRILFAILMLNAGVLASAKHDKHKDDDHVAQATRDLQRETNRIQERSDRGYGNDTRQQQQDQQRVQELMRRSQELQRENERQRDQERQRDNDKQRERDRQREQDRRHADDDRQKQQSRSVSGDANQLQQDINRYNSSNSTDARERQRQLKEMQSRADDLQRRNRDQAQQEEEARQRERDRQEARTHSETVRLQSEVNQFQSRTAGDRSEDQRARDRAQIAEYQRRASQLAETNQAQVRQDTRGRDDRKQRRNDQAATDRIRSLQTDVNRYQQQTSNRTPTEADRQRLRDYQSQANQLQADNQSRQRSEEKRDHRRIGDLSAETARLTSRANHGSFTDPATARQDREVLADLRRQADEVQGRVNSRRDREPVSQRAQAYQSYSSPTGSTLRTADSFAAGRTFQPTTPTTRDAWHAPMTAPTSRFLSDSSMSAGDKRWYATLPTQLQKSVDTLGPEGVNRLKREGRWIQVRQAFADTAVDLRNQANADEQTAIWQGAWNKVKAIDAVAAQVLLPEFATLGRASKAAQLGEQVTSRYTAHRLSTEAAESGVWRLGSFQRGERIEQALGQNLPKNFPVIDKFENGLATSIKSLDLTAKSYQDGNTLRRTVSSYIDDVASFNGRNWGGVRITSDSIRSRGLDIAIPRTPTAYESAILNDAISYAASRGVKMNVIIFP